MSDLRTAAQQALEALETLVPTKGPSIYNSARDALRAALAQQAEPLNLADPAVQKRLAAQWGYVPAAQAEPVEPVAWMCSSPELMAKGYKRFSFRCEGDWNIPVYTAPPQRLPLTEEEIERLWYPSAVMAEPGKRRVAFARAVERAHGIKE